jgi:hypothetical protein
MNDVTIEVEGLRKRFGPTVALAGMTRGCRRAVTTQAVGSIPIGVSVNQNTNSVYVTHVVQSGSMSIFRASRR